MLAPVTIITILVVCFVAFSTGNFFDDLFNPGLDKSPKFSGSQLYLLDDDNSVGLDMFNGSTIGCFGDFNNDKYTDVFVIVGNGSDTEVNIFLWDKENWQFTNSSAAIADPYIVNIAAGDFNYDGKLDLLVQGRNVSTNLIYVKIYLGNLQVLEGPIYEYDEAASQVSIIDINNDLRLDLFGEIAVWDGTSNTTKTQRVFWINTYTIKSSPHATGPLFQLSDDPFGDKPLLVPHSSAFVDINGDCLADRFVVTQDANGNPQYQLLLNGKSQGYSYAPGTTYVPMPLGSGQVAFADFDKDGNTDMLIPVCYPAPNCTKVNSIYVYFNKQKPICSLLGKSSSCRSSTDMCSADANFHLGQFNVTPPDPYFQEVVITEGDHFYFNNSIDRPLTIHVGDYNLDGYPDLLIPLIGKTGGSRVELWENTGSNSGGRRSFTKVTSNVDDLLNIPNAYAGAFFDLGDDGVLDMFVLADDPPRIETIYNNFENDAFFLKALGLNGVCTEWCPSAPKFPSPKPYGVNYVGAVFKFQYTDLNGKVQVATGTQLPQSSYSALITPYTLFGLGRTSNYIEEFFFGVPLNSSHFNYWTGSTIPNSQVVAVPYKSDAPAGWTLELYITPSGLLFWIMIAMVLSLIILAIFVYIFYRKEKKEDEQKKQEQAHLFSFDAL